MSWISIGISGGGLLFAVLCTIVGTTWSVRTLLEKRDTALVEMINKHEISDITRFGEVHAQIFEISSKFSNNLGEIGHALREQLHKLEMLQQKTVSDNLMLFVRKESFFSIIKSMDTRFDKIDTKLDNLKLHYDSGDKK